MSGEGKFTTWEKAVVWLRTQPDQAELVRNAFYDDPLIAAAERYLHSSEWKAITLLLPGHAGSALDVGAGRGIASYALARSGFDVTALEPDGSAIVGAAAIRDLAKATQLPIRVVEEFSERLPFADETFDLVFARAVLHHTRDLDSACREIFRVLRPGGMLIAVREHVISKKADLQRFLDSHPLHRLYGGEHAYLLDRYTEALNSAGFASVQTLAPLRSAINLFPHTIQTLRSAVIRELTLKVPIGPLWRVLFSSRHVFEFLLSLAERFDHRPGRLYSFVCHKV